MKKNSETVAILVALLVLGGLFWFANGNGISTQNSQTVRVAFENFGGQPLANTKIQFRWPPINCPANARCAPELAFEGTTDAAGKILVDQKVFERDQVIADVVGNYRPGEYPTITIFRDAKTGMLLIPYGSISGIRNSIFDPRREEVKIGFVPSWIVF